MKRWLFNILAAGSMVLCIAATAIWLMEAVAPPSTPWVLGEGRIRVLVTGRAFWITICYGAPEWQRGMAVLSAPSLRPPLSERMFLGFARREKIWWAIDVDDGDTKADASLAAAGVAVEYAIPHWFLCGCTLLPVLPATLRVLRTRHRHKHGLCGHCGYDLRATPDRCPECGTAVPTGHTPEVGR